MNRTTINFNLNIEPENLYAVTHKGVIVDAIRSQAFLFGELNMGKFRKQNGKTICECLWNCGELTKPGNRFILGHYTRGRLRPGSAKRWRDNNPMRDPEVIAKRSGDNHHMKRPETVAKYLGKNNPNWKEKIIVNCAFCGALKKIYPSRNHKGNHFCSNKGKCYSEWRSINNSGENCYQWKGGISHEPYCKEWNFDEFKQIIRDRDDNECQNPTCRKNYNPNHKLCVHHIDGNKKNCEPWNLISLCKGCNTRAEGNKKVPRIWWQELYQNIMFEKYGYQY